jgi:hypothetical protein
MNRIKFLIAILFFLLTGCDDVENSFDESIVFVCEGKSTLLNSKNEPIYAERDYATTIRLKKDKNTWKIKRDKNEYQLDNSAKSIDYASKNYESLLVNVQPEFIKTVRFYKVSGIRTNNTFKINRMTGRFSESEISLDGNENISKQFHSEGVCKHEGGLP